MPGPQASKVQPRSAARRQGKGRVTSVRLRVTPDRSIVCPSPYEFNGAITTNGPAEVKYTWISSNGAAWPEHTLTFTTAGTQSVSEILHAGEPYDTQGGWMQIKVLAPNRARSKPATFLADCNPGRRPKKK